MKNTKYLNFFSLAITAALYGCNNQHTMTMGDGDGNGFAMVDDFVNWDGGLGETVRNPIVSRDLLEASKKIKKCQDERNNQEFELVSLREQYSKLSSDHKNSKLKVASLQETITQKQKGCLDSENELKEEIKDLNTAISKAEADYEAGLKQVRDTSEIKVDRARENIKKCLSEKEELIADIHETDKAWRDTMIKQCPEVGEPNFRSQYLLGEQSDMLEKQAATDLAFEPWNFTGGFTAGSILFGMFYIYKRQEYKRQVTDLQNRALRREERGVTRRAGDGDSLSRSTARSRSTAN